MYYVYELIDPRDGQPFYVGKGKNARVSEHERAAAKGASGDKCDRIRAIWAADHKVVRRIVSRHQSEQDAYDAEEDRISEIGLENLTNVVPGGGVASDYWEVRRRFAALARGIRMMGDCPPVLCLGKFGDLDLPKIREMWVNEFREIAERIGFDSAKEMAAKHKISLVPASKLETPLSAECHG